MILLKYLNVTIPSEQEQSVVLLLLSTVEQDSQPVEDPLQVAHG